ncbi:hypothetical protein [Paenibacillus chibensis]|uniref:deoxynucleotide monophosphate kinase family protein n=1 Tax=Paenibacillus chibensis TaxID=59846 RepID=UPI000FD6F297|nr:hypothetical protein [Paenibacillus chibensis]MEC0370024.1 hypothetical protein [Paenibacillus chibensis]
MPALPNIGLISKLRAGKDTIAEYLEDEYGFLRYAFGDGLRDICGRLYPEQFAGGAKPRALLQSFGEYARTHDPNVWVNDMFRRISHNEYTRYQPIVVSDVRQPQEYTALQSAGYVLIRVTAPDAVRIDRAIKSGDKFSYADLMHRTETALDDYPADITVDNGGTLDELYAQIDEIVAYLNL